MVIRSPFKDYYDFVANRYGGGDPTIVYSRTKIPEDKTCVQVDSFPMQDPSAYGSFGWPPSGLEKDYIYIVIAGKAYLVSRKRDPAKLFNVNDYKIDVDPLEKKPSWYRRDQTEFRKEYPFLVDLSRQIQAPVFAVTKLDRGWGRYKSITVHIAERCPTLSGMGFPAIISAEQMYQDIAMFVGNKLKDTPDTQPPVELSNRQKILKAGFDLTQSFRHRK